MMDSEIKIMNKLIATAIECGGDSGGAYFINMENLEDVVNNWLKFKNLDALYKYVEPNYDDKFKISDCIVPK